MQSFMYERARRLRGVAPAPVRPGKSAPPTANPAPPLDVFLAQRAASGATPVADKR